MINDTCLFKCEDCEQGECYYNKEGELVYCSTCSHKFLELPLCDTCSIGILIENECVELEVCDSIDCQNGICFYNDSIKVDYHCISCAENAVEIIEAGILHCAANCSTYFMTCHVLDGLEAVACKDTLY